VERKRCFKIFKEAYNDGLDAKNFLNDILEVLISYLAEE
jgi:hypothetical protein